MAELSAKVPRVVALIDLPDLQWQMKRIGDAFGHDMTALLEQLEAGVAELGPAPGARLPLDVVYTYSPTKGPLESDASPQGRDGHAREATVGSLILRQQATEVRRECSGCYKACTHCGGTKELGGQGRGSPLADDLLELAREDQYDWAVIVSADLLLIPVVRYLQSRGRRIIHGCFPPIAMDLTKECWASIDLRSTSTFP